MGIVTTGLVLALIVATVVWAPSQPMWAPLFRRLPAPFFAYFIPACLTSAGLIPAASPLYRWTAAFLLPVCLALLVINLDLGALKKLGPSAVRAMIWAGVGMVGGLVAAYAVVGAWLPVGAWKSVGALAGSWTGGSANLIAVKEALGAGEAVFSPIVLVDALFAYSWMGLLVWLAAYQPLIQRWMGTPVFEPAVAVRPDPVSGKPGVVTPMVAVALGIGSALFGKEAGPFLSGWISHFLPAVGAGLGPSVWSVLMVTTLGLAAAGSGRFREDSDRVEKSGGVLLLFLLATLGAQASLSALQQAPAFLVLGAVALLVHGSILVVGARVSRLPFSLMATASQACIGGVVSAPLVGAVYHPRLAPVGLLLALVGNLVGTYVGLATAWTCYWVESFIK
jgi:uncharacterized membrane protein